MCEVEKEVVWVCGNKQVAEYKQVWLHLGADDSLRGSFYVGRQTKERRPVVLWEVLYYTAVVLGRHRHVQVTHIGEKIQT